MGAPFRTRPWLIAALVTSACGSSVTFSSTEDAGSDVSTPSGPRERCNGRDDDGDDKHDEGCPIRLTRTADLEWDPVLHDGVLDVLMSSGPFGTEGGGLYTLDLATDTWSKRAGTFAGYLCIDDEGQAATADGTGCYVHDLVQGTQTTALRVAPGSGVFQQRCAVDGEYMVTSASIGVWSYFDIFYYRLSDGAVGSISLPFDQMYPAIDDGLIVFGDRRDFALWAYQIGGGREPYRVTPAPMRTYDLGHRPILHDGTVLFSHDCAVELYDASTTELVFTTTADALCDATSFAFSSRFIAVGVDQKIRLVDRRTGEVHAVTTYDRDATDATLDERYLVYRDDRTDSFDLYRIDLSDFDEGDFFPEGVAP